MNGPSTEGSCADPVDWSALSFDEATQHILEAVEPVAGVERCALGAALGRVSAADVTSPIDVPAHVNSAMDGYALAGAELPIEGVRLYTVAGTALAGQPFEGHVGQGQCVRIMTGAVMPSGTDSVVMQEQATTRANGRVAINGGHRAGQNVRQAGEDLARGQTAVSAGTWLTPAELGLLASLGMAEVSVRRRPRAAFFSTGDELRSVGQLLHAGQVYDSNRYTLKGMLTRVGLETLDMGVVADTPKALEKALLEASSVADVVLTTGGVSVGEADHVRGVLGTLGAVGFWKIAIKPGRPLAFGRIGGSVFFGLPGNPVAVMVTFYQLVRPALALMQGRSRLRPMRFTVPALESLKKRPGRTEFLRGRLQPGKDGKLGVLRAGAQGSGVLSSMSRADCFIVLPPDLAGVAAGDPVEVEPFEGLL